MAKNPARTALVSSTTNATGATTRGRWDVSSLDGGVLTLAITNGGTGPSTQCVARILIAHKDTSMPAAGSEGTGDADWKIVHEFVGGTAAGAKTRYTFRFGPEVAYIEVEFVGNTGQGVTVEAIGTGFSY